MKLGQNASHNRTALSMNMSEIIANRAHTHKHKYIQQSPKQWRDKNEKNKIKLVKATQKMLFKQATNTTKN